MTLYGITGKILEVDLTKNKISKIPPNKSDYKSYIGGSGLATKLLYPDLTKELDPLSPKNPLGFFNGPLVGTRTPNCGRHVVVAKSPQTNIFGESNSGGKFGTFLKFLGFDGIIIRGKAEEPVSLTIIDEDINLESAKDLWGKNVFDVEKLLNEKYNKVSSFATIGVAGENLVKIAALMNDGDRAAGRTGLGAVMGSKNLKSIVLKSSTRNVPVAHEEELKVHGAKMRKHIKEHSVGRTLFGTAAYVSGGMKWGDVPVRYWYKGHMSGTEKFDGARMKETILLKRYHCYGCIIGCGRIVKIDEGKYAIPETAGPEYETLAGFGTNLMIDDLEGICMANYLCNDLGLDTISASQIIAMTFHLHEKGAITKEDLGDITKTWGNIDAVNTLLQRIANREGIGDILAEGSDSAACHFGKPDEAHTVNGLELPYHDPRAFFSMATVYATSSRGACHNNGDGYKMSLGVVVPEIGLNECKDRFDDIEGAQIAAKVQDFRAINNALIMCHFANPTFTDTVKALELATGWEYSFDEIMLVGERINNLKRLVNKQMGYIREDDRLPKVMSFKLQEGGTEGNIPNLEVQLKEYYKVRNWDPKTGFPTTECLNRLALSDFVG